MRHVADQVARVMKIRAEVIRQLEEHNDSPVRRPRTGCVRRTEASVLPHLSREDEVIVAQYTRAAVALDVGDSVQEAIDRGNPT